MGGYVKASALAPIRSAVLRLGGRIERVLAAAELPPAILGRPDLALPLTDHYAVLAAAARETGTPWFGAEMGAAARIGMLGRYGVESMAAPTLGAALRRAGALLNRMMQTDTDLVLFPLPDGLRWSMVFHTRGHEGRAQNELLALGYQLDLMRGYLGPGWVPRRIELRQAGPAGGAVPERLFGAPVRPGCAVPGIVFDRALLGVAHPAPRPVAGASRGIATAAAAPPAAGDPAAAAMPAAGDPAAAAMPAAGDPAATVRALVRIALLEGRPAIDGVARRLGLSRRSLQRGLGRGGETWSGILDAELCREAQRLLGAGLPAGEVADRLGYADPAHFTRAYRRWTGLGPAAHRRVLSAPGDL